MNKKSEAEIRRERAKNMEIGPDTAVLHVIGSERYHLYRQCKKLGEDETVQREKGITPETIGRLFGEMNALNRMVQNSSMKLNETGKLELCADCDEKRKNTRSKNPDAGI